LENKEPLKIISNGKPIGGDVNNPLRATKINKNFSRPWKMREMQVQLISMQRMWMKTEKVI